LIGNYYETNNETTAVARQQPSRQWTGWKAEFSAGSTPMAAKATMDTTMRIDVFYTVRADGLSVGKV
jgi:hypothetical protein